MTAKVIQDEIELEKLKQFLQSNNLPSWDISLDQNLFIGYYDVHEALVASGGLEFYGNVALLRSVAVNKILRMKSFGKQIVDDLINNAKAHQIKELYLLTETAHDFFLKKGFRDTPRTAYCMVRSIS
jgi:amino-acid N-acetyltransferase